MLDKNKLQGNNVPDSGLPSSEPKGQHPNKPENSLSPKDLFGPSIVVDIQKQFDDLAESLKNSLKEQENAIFEGLQLNLEKLEKKINESDKKKEALEDKIAASEKKNKEFTRDLRKAEHAVKSMSREVKVTERKSLEFLGIFITLFTFISVSASTVLQFKNVHHSIFFLASFCFCLLLFLHLFHLVLRNEKIGKACWVVFYTIAGLSCTIGATLCYYYGKEIPNTKDDGKNSIQINYTQTNGYDQTISPLIQPNTSVSK